MKRLLITVAMTVLLPGFAAAATLSTVVDARYQSGGTAGGDSVTEVTDTSSGVLTQALDTFALAASGASSAAADVDHANRRLLLSSTARNSGSAGEALHWARARTEVTSRYRVEGNGTLFLTLATAGFATALTDRDDNRSLTHLLAGFRVETPNETVSERVSSADPSGPIFGLNGNGFSIDLGAAVDVQDGDVLTLTLFGLADSGDFPNLTIPRTPLGSFFDARAEISASLSLREDGIRLVPEEISPVPLPAGLPLLVAGLASLALARRRQAAQ